MNELTYPLFVLTDIHGCAEELKLLLEKLPLTPNATFIFLGDYVDRGPDSKGVIDIILKLKKSYKVITLMGNHEQMFIEFLRDDKTAKAGMFIYNGGSATLASYSKDKTTYSIPDEHLLFLAEDLLHIYETDNYIFVHAGLPNIPLKNINMKDHGQDMLWMREPFLDSKYNWGKTVIHGHTPYEMASIENNRINLDTGCVFNNKLTAMQLPEKKLYNVEKMTSSSPEYLQDSITRITHRFVGTIPITMSLTSESNKINLFTVDYNEFGMLVTTSDISLRDLFVEESDVSGKIGNSDYADVLFEGFVVRQILDKNKLLLAIKFTRPPFNDSDALTQHS